MSEQSSAEQLLADYRRSREQLASVHRALAGLSVSESSHDGAITVTVGAQGGLTGLSLHEDACRYYRPRRLAETIVSLAAAAARRASAEAAHILAPVLPPGADPGAFLAGSADLRPAEIAPPPRSLYDTDDHLGRSWLEQTQDGRRR